MDTSEATLEQEMLTVPTRCPPSQRPAPTKIGKAVGPPAPDSLLLHPQLLARQPAKDVKHVAVLNEGSGLEPLAYAEPLAQHMVLTVVAAMAVAAQLEAPAWRVAMAVKFAGRVVPGAELHVMRAVAEPAARAGSHSRHADREGHSQAAPGIQHRMC